MSDEAAAPAATEGVDTGSGDTGSTTTVLTDDGTADASQAGADTNSDVGAAEASAEGADAGAEGSDAGAADGSDAGAEGSDTPPDTYADFVMPDGVELSTELMNDVTPILQKYKVTQEDAQLLVDAQAKQVQAGSQTQIDNFNQLMSDWQASSKNDGEFGGDKFEESVKIAQSAVSKYGTPELKQLLEDHGVGNHPEVVRFMVRVGHTLKEDVPGSSGAATSKAGDHASILYPQSKDS